MTDARTSPDTDEALAERFACACFDGYAEGPSWSVVYQNMCSLIETLRGPAQTPLMEATQAQHIGLPKGEPAKFVRSGKLETCQCRDCRDLAQSLPSHWAIEESTPNDGFECYFLLRDGITVGEFSGRQTDQRSRHLRDLVDAANKGAPVTSTPAQSPADDEDRMEKISSLIARLQSTMSGWGDTCVYIRRGGLSWGAVALNRRDDDQKHGVFDLQAQHDRDMEQRAGRVERLIADRNHWMERATAAEAKASVVTSTACDDTIKPHIYMPDYQAMGDCRVCGHEQDKPWHSVPSHHAQPSEQSGESQ